MSANGARDTDSGIPSLAVVALQLQAATTATSSLVLLAAALALPPITQKIIENNLDQVSILHRIHRFF